MDPTLQVRQCVPVGAPRTLHQRGKSTTQPDDTGHQTLPPGIGWEGEGADTASSGSPIQISGRGYTAHVLGPGCLEAPRTLVLGRQEMRVGTVLAHDSRAGGCV